MLLDADLQEKLVPTILQLLNDKEALARMRESAKAMARPDAAEAIARQLWQIARDRAVAQVGALP
jgi:UDP-N-acetylglucosamine:LPS N-acetylglucosamine transferase